MTEKLEALPLLEMNSVWGEFHALTRLLCLDQESGQLSGKQAAALFRELCDKFGRVAGQADYLGDMGTPPPYAPGDFAAWFEAYIGDGWYTFDARNNVPRIGRVLLARGRDACDVAITTTFGPNTLESFKVWTDDAAEAIGPGR
jgi:hypothetical protein